MSGLSLEGKIVGLIGFGAIGQWVARQVVAFGSKVIAYDPYANLEVAEEIGVQITSKDDVLSQSDFLSLHCPLIAETSGLVNAGFLGKMKPGSFLINTSRGELVDEGALHQSLESGHLRGAGLDVFSKQPPDAGNPLLALSQVICTPHMGAHTDGAASGMGWGALNDCLAVLRGEVPVHRVI